MCLSLTRLFWRGRPDEKISRPRFRKTANEKLKAPNAGAVGYRRGRSRRFERPKATATWQRESCQLEAPQRLPVAPVDVGRNAQSQLAQMVLRERAGHELAPPVHQVEQPLSQRAAFLLVALLQLQTKQNMNSLNTLT